MVEEQSITLLLVELVLVNMAQICGQVRILKLNLRTRDLPTLGCQTGQTHPPSPWREQNRT